MPAQCLISLRTSDQAYGLCVAQSLGCPARLPLLTCQSFALWPGPRCPSSSPAPLTQSWVWGRVLWTTPLDYWGRRASPGTCSTESVPVVGQTSASSTSSLGSPFSAGSPTSPVTPTGVEGYRREEGWTEAGESLTFLDVTQVEMAHLSHCFVIN